MILSLNLFEARYALLRDEQVMKNTNVIGEGFCASSLSHKEILLMIKGG